MIPADGGNFRDMAGCSQFTVKQDSELRSCEPRVVIGFSPSLPYCTIFSLISSDIVDLHIYMYACLFIPVTVYATHTLNAAAALARGPAPVTVPIHLFCLLAGD